VTGGTFDVAVGLVFFAAGAGDSLGVEAAGVVAGEGVVAAVVVAAELAAGVGCAVIVGGGVGLVAAGVWDCERSCAATEAISAGSFCATALLPASEASGAGPMAAPTAMPTPSMTVASTALARAEGRRTERRGDGAEPVLGGGPAAGWGGESGGWGLSMFCKAVATFQVLAGLTAPSPSSCEQTSLSGSKQWGL
jgi:hypothetical protein